MFVKIVEMAKGWLVINAKTRQCLEHIPQSGSAGKEKAVKYCQEKGWRIEK